MTHKSVTLRNIITGSVIALIIAFLGVSTLSAKDITRSNEANLKYKLVTVEEGDSLWQLVNQAGLDFNIGFLVEQTRKYNNLESSYLTAGQKIYIPCSE